MQKWKYSLAILIEGNKVQATDGEIGASIEETGLGPFLKEAGERGWELCAHVPKSKDAWLIFKKAK